MLLDWVGQKRGFVWVFPFFLVPDCRRSSEGEHAEDQRNSSRVSEVWEAPELWMLEARFRPVCCGTCLEWEPRKEQGVPAIP